MPDYPDRGKILLLLLFEIFSIQSGARFAHLLPLIPHSTIDRKLFYRFSFKTNQAFFLHSTYPNNLFQTAITTTPIANPAIYIFLLNLFRKAGRTAGAIGALPALTGVPCSDASKRRSWA